MILVMAFPIFILIFTLINIKRLIGSSFKAKYGSLYENVKTNSAYAALYNLFFVLRRILFAIMAVVLTEHPLL